MLYEIFCDKFGKTINGSFVPTGRIRFHKGLNTVLGDKHAENSIGKSTFLLVVDFCFGGNDYVNSEINNAKDFVTEQRICFAFQFGDKIEYYARDIINHHEVVPCDDNYSPIENPIPVKEFCKHLYESYGLTAPASFRDIVGRYVRVYGRENYDERHPLKYATDKEAEGIIALEKLFGIYSVIENYRTAYESIKAQAKTHKQASDFGQIRYCAKTITEVKKNEEEIAALTEQLSQMTMCQDVDLSTESYERIDSAADIKLRLRVLRRHRTQLITQRNTLNDNLSNGQLPVQDDLNELSTFFPNVRTDRLIEIEQFHVYIHQILVKEMQEETERLNNLIDNLSKEIAQLEEEQRSLGLPVNISTKYMKKYTDISQRITNLSESNEQFESYQQMKENERSAKESLAAVRESQLTIVQTTLNQEMVRLNDSIYDGSRFAPAISFKSMRSGDPGYDFSTQADGGTGTNYKGLILFDLSVFKNTELPILIHDSLLFKNIADLPVARIMSLYSHSEKQIFIAFDKTEAFSDETRQILDSTKVLELYENGGELFGWMWAKQKE